MARKVDLIGLGFPPFLASKLANDVATVTLQGSSVGSALALATDAGTIVVTGTNAGAGGVLPSMNPGNVNQVGASPGDELIVNNQISASVIIYAPSAATISGGGVNTAGTTGISVGSHKSTRFIILTASSWAAVIGA